MTSSAKIEPFQNENPANHSRGGSRLNANRALVVAWVSWAILLFFPVIVFVAAMYGSLGQPNADIALSETFFVASLAWMIVTVPLAFLLRGYIFRSWWGGETVEPASYIKGMLAIWLSAEIGGLIALAGVWVSHLAMPCLLPAALALMLFMPFWPNGSAMSDKVGNATDDEVFRYPR